MKISRSGPFRAAAALLLIAAVLCSGAVLAFFGLDVYRPAGEEVEAMRGRIRDARYIIHAGGFLTTDGGERVNYTNSYDGLVNLWENGSRVCEFDLTMTSDGVPVCAHSADGCFSHGTDLPEDAGIGEFLSAKIYGRFTPMTLDDLAGFMRAHTELLVITDVKDGNERMCRFIADAYPDLMDNFIIQIYHENEYDPIRAMGFRYIIYTLYRATDEEKRFVSLLRFTYSHELVGLTMRFSLYENSRRWRYGVRKTGVPIMLHTVNDREVIDECLEQELCIGVYTDLTEFPEQSELPTPGKRRGEGRIKMGSPKAKAIGKAHFFANAPLKTNK